MPRTGHTLTPQNCEGIRYLSTEDLIWLNRLLILLQTPDEPSGVLQPDLLASSQQRPSSYSYYEQTRDMFELAAVLIESLTQNHPFRNANKRTAFAAGSMFLLLNGYEVNGPGHEVVELMEGLAMHTYTVADVENWLAYWSHESSSQQLNDPGEWLAQFVSEYMTPDED